MRITKTVVDRLAANSFAWDSGLIGFGVRRQLRSAFYLIRYRVGGRQRYFTIGRHGELAPDQARKEAQRLLGEIASGKPLTKVETNSFGEAIERYLAHARARLRARTLVEIERHLRRYSAALHSLRLDAITRRDVAGVLTSYEGSTRNRVRASLSSMFSWAVKEGLAELNPVPQTWKLAEPSRSRVLTGDELRRIWLALPSDDYGTIVKLLLLTGQRRDEIGGLQWSEINLDATLTLPESRTKIHREHTLPLSAQALALLPNKGEGKLFAFNNWHKAKTRLDLKARVSGWRLHDLRRTCATGMAELGVQPHIIEAVLNHVSGHKAGVAGIYNRAKYSDEMRSALQKWADHLDQITT
jgi:integrase